MVIDKVIGRLGDTDKRIDTVILEWFERDKKRMRKKTESGEDIGICVDEALQENDILAEDEERVIVVTFAPCELIHIKVSSMQEMGRLCFELGNKHMSLAVKENSVTIPYDALIYSQLQHLNFAPEKVWGKFTDYIVCRGHGNNHEHSKDEHHTNDMHIHIHNNEQSNLHIKGDDTAHMHVHMKAI